MICLSLTLSSLQPAKSALLFTPRCRPSNSLRYSTLSATFSSCQILGSIIYLIEMDDLHNTTGQIPGLIPSFSLNDFSLQLPLASSTPHPLAPPVPRVPIPPKRTPKLVRPSTASAIEEKASVLPSLPNGSNIEVPTPDHSASKGVNANISVASVVRVASVQQLKSHPPLLGTSKQLLLIKQALTSCQCDI